MVLYECQRCHKRVSREGLPNINAICACGGWMKILKILKILKYEENG
jgi:hypothetical protein